MKSRVIKTKGGADYIDVQEAAERTGMSTQYLCRLARAGTVRANKVGVKWWFHSDDINKYDPQLVLNAVDGNGNGQLEDDLDGL